MAKIKFGQIRYGEDKYGATYKGRQYYNRTWRGKYLGLEVHGTMGVYKVEGVKQYDKAVIYYFLHGKQHKVPFLEVYPDGAPDSGAGGDKLIAARIIYSTFTPEEKAPYVEAAKKEMLTDGFNIYLREYNIANP